MTERRRPRLTLSHSTLYARDIDSLSAFYRDVLGFHVTDRGPVPGGGEIVFLSQDPAEHHQIAMVSAEDTPPAGFVMVEHLAFRTGSLDDLRALQTTLAEAGVEGVLPICHGNAFSLYFPDPEGNGVECFVDSPFHVAQPFAQGLDLTATDEEIVETTRAMLAEEAGFQPVEAWRSEFGRALDA